MQDFEYVCAENVQQVISLLAADGDQTCILSGGTDLLVQLRENRRKARLLVDIKRLPEVNLIAYDPADGLHLGAAVPCYRIREHEIVARRYPGLIDAVSLIGGAQIQGRASVGGNLCNASPAADSIPALIVHQAECLIAGPGGTRRVRVEHFCTAPGKTVLQPGEFLIQIHLPPPEAGFGAAYLRFTPRNEMDIAVAGAGASLRLDESGERILEARLALAAVAARPLFVPQVGEYLAGRQVSEEAFAEAARLAREAAHPINDLRGAIEQRKHLSGVLARRAFEIAIRRARAAMESGVAHDE